MQAAANRRAARALARLRSPWQRPACSPNRPNRLLRCRVAMVSAGPRGCCGTRSSGWPAGRPAVELALFPRTAFALTLCAPFPTLKDTLSTYRPVRAVRGQAHSRASSPQRPSDSHPLRPFPSDSSYLSLMSASFLVLMPLKKRAYLRRREVTHAEIRLFFNMLVHIITL